MIATLKPYPAYKDSGVPWLGEVPVHWDVRRTKTLFQSRKQLNTDGSETNVLSLTLRGVVNNDPDNPEGLVPKDYKTYQIFERDDLVFKLIDLENVRTSRVGLVHERGIMSPAYVRLTLSGMGEVRFYYQQFYDLYQRSIYNQIGEGVRSTIRWSDLANLRILAPPLPEQTAIVRFLDWAERRIRRVIRVRQRRIKLLEEYKQALIHQAVTGRIDVRSGLPYPAYKDSGVEWLGQVPEHWDVLRLKYVARLRSGESITSQRIKETGDYPVYGGNGIRGFTSLFTHEGEFVLIGRQGALCGNINYANGRFWASEHAVVVHPLRKCLTHWLGELLRRMNLNQYSIAAAQPGLAVERIQNLAIPFPPIDEQEQIDQYIKNQVNAFDAAIAADRRAIELLQEFRTRLIADVVTGKVDVREVAARLPEEPPEKEAELMDTDETAEGEATDDDAAAEALSEEEFEP